MISTREIEAAATELYAWGIEHGWWSSPTTFDALDPIGREEFKAIIERVLLAAAAVRGDAG